MGERILFVGRAGTGKTRGVMDRMAEFLAAGHSAKALFLLPTISQANHLKRLFLSRYEDLAGFFDESIVTFTGLAERLLERTRSGRRIGDLLSGRRQDLLLRAALERDPEGPFREMVHRPGFRHAALAFLKELKQNGLPFEETVARLRALGESRPGVTEQRLTAFAALFTEYETLREEAGFLDHEDYLRETRNLLRDGEGDLEFSFLGVDGFQNFTRLQGEILLLLSGRSAETIVTLPGDPADSAVSPFAVANETGRFLREHGFRPVVLERNFRACDAALRELEAGLFAREPRPLPATVGLTVFEGADPEDEADRVARRVIELTRDEDAPRACREIVIIVRDVAVHAERFRRIFARHGVPLRIYGADDFSCHPYVRSVLSLLRVATGDSSPDAVFPLLRADHLRDVSPSAVDRVEERVRAEPAPDSLAGWATAIEADLPLVAHRLRSLTAPGTLSEVLPLVDRFLAPLWERDLSDPELLRREARARELVIEAVADAAFRFRLGGGEAEADPAAIVSALSERLASGHAAVSDRRLEAVNLIDAREARQWEAPVVFVAGLVEGQFPRNPREDIFLDDAGRQDANRDRTRDAGSLAFRERLLEREEERYLFYVALTRARERLFLSWPGTDGGGEATLPSLFLRDVLRALPEENAVSRRRLSDVLPLPGETVSRDDLRRRALRGLATPYRDGTGEERAVVRESALHDALGGDEAYGRAAGVGVRFLRPPEAYLARPSARGRSHSPSALEDYAQCPFRHFAGRILRLRAPARGPGEGLDARILGDIAHEVMEQAFRCLIDEGSLPTDSELTAILDRSFAQQTIGMRPGVALSRERRRLGAAVRQTLERESERMAASPFQPAGTEESFRLDWDGLRLSGRVDRIDVAPDGRAVLLDYKYSVRGFDAGRKHALAEGAHFQLPVYLAALREVFAHDPAGAWLLPMRKPRLSGISVGDSEPGLKAMTLDEEGLEALLASTRDRVVAIDAAIREGEIPVRPRDPGECGHCDFADLCRVELWRREGDA